MSTDDKSSLDHVAPAYILGVLPMTVIVLMSVLNYLDRQILSILNEAIKADLSLSDGQIGLLSGFGFALIYTVLGLPVARLAQRKHRGRIAGVILIVWSGFTVLAAFAQNFVQLLFARFGVAVGEAGATPITQSLIADYTPRARRATALSIASAGAPLGALLGMSIGGLVLDSHGWRMAFCIAGLPGFLLALIVFFVLRDPLRQIKEHGGATAAAATISYRKTFSIIAKSRTYWLMCAATALKSFINFGTGAFLASFFFRAHAEDLAAAAAGFGLKSAGFLGLTLGLSSGIAGAVGAVAGGRISDWAGRNDVRGYMVAPAVASLLLIPAQFVVLTAGSIQMALGFVVLSTFLSSLWYGPTFATVQGVVPSAIRPSATAILFFVSNLIGLGLGPTLVGMASQFLDHTAGYGPTEGLRWALIGASSIGLAAACIYLVALRTIRRDIID